MKYVLAVIGASLLAALPAAALAKTCQLKGNVMSCDSGSYVIGGSMAAPQDEDAPANAPADPGAQDSDPATDSAADSPDAAADPAEDQDPALTDPVSQMSPDALLKCVEKHPYAPCR